MLKEFCVMRQVRFNGLNQLMGQIVNNLKRVLTMTEATASKKYGLAAGLKVFHNF